MMGRPTDGSRISNTGGKGSPELSASSAGVCYELGGVTKRQDAEQRKERFGAPLPGTPNVGFRVPAKPLRFEYWGAHEDLSLPRSLSPNRKA